MNYASKDDLPDQNRLFHFTGFKNILWIKESEMRELGQYNATLPTGTTIGKRWIKAKPRHPKFLDLQQFWICEYVPDPEPNMVGIKYWTPIVIKGQ